MKTTRLAILLALALGPASLASPAPRHVRIGYVAALPASATPAPGIELLRQALRAKGWVEGQNLTLEARDSNGKDERLPELLAELVRLKVDVLVTEPAIVAARRATGTIPIVAVGGDLLATRLIASLVRPGGNVTGLTHVEADLAGPRLELLQKLIEPLPLVALLADYATDVSQLRGAGSTAASLGIKLDPYGVRKPEDFDEAFTAMKKKRVRALVIAGGPVIHAQRREIAEFVVKSRLPAIAPYREFAEAGGLMAYGPNYPDLYRRVAGLIDQILKGARPQDLPVERPARFDLTVNLGAAKALGITLPQSVLRKADRVVQ